MEFPLTVTWGRVPSAIGFALEIHVCVPAIAEKGMSADMPTISAIVRKCFESFIRDLIQCFDESPQDSERLPL